MKDKLTSLTKYLIATYNLFHGLLRKLLFCNVRFIFLPCSHFYFPKSMLLFSKAPFSPSACIITLQLIFCYSLSCHTFLITFVLKPTTISLSFSQVFILHAVLSIINVKYIALCPYYLNSTIVHK
jgi:hypothetical protein